MKVNKMEIWAKRQKESQERVYGKQDKELMRTFPTGATRDDDTGKIDPEGFLSPIVIQRYCEYLNKHRTQSDGEIRSSDNWQLGITKSAYMKSLLRHVLSMWTHHRGFKTGTDLQEDICGVIFNACGYLFEILKDNASKSNCDAI